MWKKCCCFCFRESYEPPDVQELDYRHNSLTEVPAEIFTYERTLEKLLLASNQISDLPPNLFYCHELRELDICDNELKEIPAAIESLTRLSKLNVNRNALTEIPESIKNCKNLTYLDLGLNQLSKIPESICQLVHLEELFLNETALDFLPANFGRLTKLKNLELRDNTLVSLPMSMNRLSQLQRLDIGCNEMEELPAVIGSMTNLVELWADDNAMQQDCNSRVLGNLPKLTCLDLSKNNITSISDHIGKCGNLTDITLSFNDLPEMPSTFTKLENVTTIRVDNNRLTRLPEDLGKMKNLQELNLSFNLLRSLPLSVGLLRKLHTLYLDDNRLSELPKEIGSCTSLTVLSVANNGLREIPSEIGHLSNLRVLILTNNYIRYLPVSILGLTKLGALWLTEGQNKPLVTLNREIDSETGQHVVTCCLLPQILSPDMPVSREPKESREEAAATPRRSGRKIRFESDIELPSPEKPASNGGLLRAPTPYPKELRAMAKHASHIRQAKNQNGEAVNISDEPMYEGDLNEDGVDSQAKPDFELKPISERHQQQDNQANSYRHEESAATVLVATTATDASSSYKNEVIQYPVSVVVDNEASIANSVNTGASSRDYSYQQPLHRSGIAPQPSQPLDVEQMSAAAMVVVTSVTSPPSSASCSVVGRTPPPYHIAAQRAAFFRSSGGAGTGKINFGSGETKNSVSGEDVASNRQRDHQSPSDTPPKSPDLVAGISASNNNSNATMSYGPNVPQSSSNSAGPTTTLATNSAIIGGGNINDTAYGHYRQQHDMYDSTNLNDIYVQEQQQQQNQSGRTLLNQHITTERIMNENTLMMTPGEVNENVVPELLGISNMTSGSSAHDDGIQSDRNGNITTSKPYTHFDQSNNTSTYVEENGREEALPPPMPLLMGSNEHHSPHHHKHPHLHAGAAANSSVQIPETSHIPKPTSYKLPEPKVCRIPSLQTATSAGTKRYNTTSQIGGTVSAPSRIPSSTMVDPVMDARRPPAAPHGRNNASSSSFAQPSPTEHQYYGKTANSSKIPGGMTYSSLSPASKTSTPKRNAALSPTGIKYGGGASGSSVIPKIESPNIPSPAGQPNDMSKVYSRIPKLESPRALSDDMSIRASSSTNEEVQITSAHPLSGVSTTGIPRGPSKFSRSGSGRDSDHGMESKIRKPWIFGTHKNARVVSVEHRKTDQSNLGFSIVEFSTHPEGKGIYIAATDSEDLLVKVGDKILQVDGIDVGDMGVEIVNKILSNCQESIQLLVTRQH